MWSAPVLADREISEIGRRMYLKSHLEWERKDLQRCEFK